MHQFNKMFLHDRKIQRAREKSHSNSDSRRGGERLGSSGAILERVSTSGKISRGFDVSLVSEERNTRKSTTRHFFIGCILPRSSRRYVKDYSSATKSSVEDSGAKSEQSFSERAVSSA